MISEKQAKWIYQKMIEIRRFEETAWELFSANKIHGSVHLYIGEEAIAATVCSFMDKEDCITSTHRGHGHCIAKGGTLKRTLAEMMGRDTGYCCGRSGSMHIADFEYGNLGANAIVAGGIPMAVGAALAQQMDGNNHFTVAFFGDGASNQGPTHESMNLAAVWKLPVIFLCENNSFAISTSVQTSTSIHNIADRGAAYGMPGITVDGNDVPAIYDAMKEARAHVLAGKGPMILECKTGRWRGHWTGDPETYRDPKDVDYWKSHCPIAAFRKYMLVNGLAKAEELAAIEKSVESDMEEAVEYALSSPQPDPVHVTDNVFFEA